MTTSRRNFLEELLIAGIATGAFSSSSFAGHSKSSKTSLFNPQTGPDVHSFWNDFFTNVQEPNTRGKPQLTDRDRKVQYLHFNEGKGLRYLGDVKADELLEYDGDVTVTATLGQFRPGTEDQQLLESVKSSSLRVDFVQTKSFMNVLAPMAWAALAVFEHDKANKLPTVNQLGYQKNFMDGRILLPGGTGKFALNVFPVKPESTLHKILKFAIPAVMAAAPVLNLPAISIPVLKTITQMYLGPKEEESYGKPLLNSFPVRWSATQQAFAESLEAEKFPLVDGNYIMVPQSHTDELGKSFSSLDLQQGFLVSKDASKNDSPTTRVMQAIPGVTYVTMNLKVTKVPSNGLKTNTVGDQVDMQPDSGDKKNSTKAAPPKQAKPTTPSNTNTASPPKKKP
jgi:hypothetical protein